MRKKSLALTLMLAFSWLLGGGDLMGQGPVYTIGSGSSTTSYIPLRTGNNYSYSEQIYTATELTNAGCPEGSITKIALKMTSNASFSRKLDIYMKATSKASFESTSAINVLSSDLVYSSGESNVSFSYNVWTVITLDNAFVWDGESNVMVLIYDKTGNNESSSYSFNYYSSSNGSLYYSSSSAISNITSLPSGIRNNGKNVVQLTIEATSTPRPKSLTFSNIGANTATISWTSPSNTVVDYTYQYQLSGGDWSSPIGENTVSGTSADLSGLTAKRSYDVRVKANYANNQTSEWATKSFNTAVNLPYSYGFEEASELNFWTLKDASAYTTIDNGNAHNGTKSFKFNGTGDNQYLISPLLVTASSGVHVEFYYKISNSSYSQKLKVGYSTGDINSFTYSDDVITVNSTSYPDEPVKFDFTHDNIKYIAIQFDRNSNWQYTYIDDISISTCTTCGAPSDVTCTAITATSATLGWTSNVGSYEIYITDDENDVPNSNSTTDITSDTESKTINSLSAGTTYYAYVRACCDEESKSDWSSVCQFTPTVAQSTTVNVGTETTNRYVPFYGSYANKTETQGQYIIPASALTALANGQITKLAVYGTANQSFTSTFKVHLAEVSQTTLSSIYTGDMVEVYSGTLATDANGLMEIDFSTTYNYNGSNLLVDFIVITTGNTATINWVNIETTENTAYYQYKGYQDAIYAYSLQLLPKTTLTYIPSIEFNSNGNWNTATNWEINTLPATTYNVTIDAACTIPSGCDAEVNNIIINSGESLTVASGGSLTVNGTMTVEGTMTINGTFNYSEEPENLVIEDGGQLILPKTSTGIQATVKKETYGATTKDTKTDYYWYAISSAVANPNISSKTNLITETEEPYHYDLYRFNETINTTTPWENYRAGHADFTTLEPGRGYLYRNASDLSIAMTGEINVADFNYAVTKTGSGVLAGFNLIGNPYSHDIYKGAGTAIPNGTEFLRTGFYYMDPTTGKWTTGTDNSTAIKPNEAIFVQTDAKGNITMTNTNASSSAKANNDNIMFKVSNSQYSDETYAWFDKGRGLNKINHRNAEVPMLYINQDGENYAIATMSDDTKTFSLNLKAMTTGKYTLSYKTKGEFSYLHVIDRFTGEDVDMLLEGEYSFVASPIDNDARFIVRLEYTSNYGDTDSSVFAYQNGNDIIVSGEGELQVFDVTGRKVMSAAINSSFETISGLSKGFYIFKLNEKTQKIVVR